MPNAFRAKLNILHIVAAVFCAFIIIGLAVNALYPSKLLQSKISHDLSFKISGMTCQGCVKKIENALASMDIEDVNIDLESSNATMKTNLDEQKIKSKIESLGFTLND